jgi:hypothetical protein
MRHRLNFPAANKDGLYPSSHVKQKVFPVTEVSKICCRLVTRWPDLPAIATDGPRWNANFDLFLLGLSVMFAGPVWQRQDDPRRIILHMLAPTSGTITFRGADSSKIRGRQARLEFMSHVQPVTRR